MSIRQQKYYNILLIGDSCFDVYHYGVCERVSPEAPVLVMKKQGHKIVDGMCGNVKNNIDGFSNYNNVVYFTNPEEISKNRFVDTNYNQQLLRVDEGEAFKLKPFDIKLIPDSFEPNAIVISDYDKGFVTRDVAEYLCKRYIDIPTFVDSKKKDLSCFSNCFIKINKKERKGAFKINESCKVITTLGSEGAEFEGKRYKCDKVDVYDVSGAGDVFLSVLSSSYVRGLGIERSIMYANKCASYSVTKNGTYCMKDEDYEKIGFFYDIRF